MLICELLLHIPTPFEKNLVVVWSSFGGEVPVESHEELIPKKEVLRLTGISYGQLYRWKRLGLIPEAWFIRR
ncbi:MAG: YhbD family protein, partial [Candidatus Bipolaricaulota bacterium]|nr:YhbD family protein [Candidatus Bipolaricaulota bacterium]MDW8126589.1 DUF4004 family protein [Candidatus Bipolaricaulota bacterium]